MIVLSLLLVALALGWPVRAHGADLSTHRGTAGVEVFLPKKSLYWLTLVCCLGAIGFAYADDLQRKVVLVSQVKWMTVICAPLLAATWILLKRSFAMVGDLELVISSGWRPAVIPFSAVRNFQHHPWGFWVMDYESGGLLKRQAIWPWYYSSERLIRLIRQRIREAA